MLDFPQNLSEKLPICLFTNKKQLKTIWQEEKMLHFVKNVPLIKAVFREILSKAQHLLFFRRKKTKKELVPDRKNTHFAIIVSLVISQPIMMVVVKKFYKLSFRIILTKIGHMISMFLYSIKWQKSCNVTIAIQRKNKNAWNLSL